MTLRPYSQTLQQAYRDTLGTPGAPEAIDDSVPVTPVAVVAQVNTANTSAFTRITDGTDTALVDTAGTLRVNGQRAMQRISGSNASAAVPTTLGTVPASTVWRIYGAIMSITAPNAAITATAVMNAGGTVLLTTPYNSAAGQYPHIEQVAMFGENYVEITAGQTVTLLVANGGATATAVVFYEAVAV